MEPTPSDGPGDATATCATSADAGATGAARVDIAAAGYAPGVTGIRRQGRGSQSTERADICCSTGGRCPTTASECACNGASAAGTTQQGRGTQSAERTGA